MNFKIGGKVVAYFNKDTLTLEKNIKGSRHILRSPLAIAIDQSVIAYAESMQGMRVVVTDTENGKQYIAPLSHFKHHGVKINRGFGNQIALPLKYWNTETNTQQQGQLNI